MSNTNQNEHFKKQFSNHFELENSFTDKFEIPDKEEEFKIKLNKTITLQNLPESSLKIQKFQKSTINN
jgi:hypothetical protein